VATWALVKDALGELFVQGFLGGVRGKRRH
jgi:hypothetical protein